MSSEPKKTTPPKFYASALDSLWEYHGSRRRAQLITWFCAAVFGLVIVGGVAVLVTWLALRPHKPRYYVDYASLTQFSISPDESLLNTSMVFNVTSWNPNERIGIEYDRVDAYAYYYVDRIAGASLPPFYQEPRNTTVLQLLLTGNSVVLEKVISRDLALEHTSGTVELALKLYAKIRFKVGTWKSSGYSMSVRCDLFVDVNGGSMDRKQCGVYV